MGGLGALWGGKRPDWGGGAGGPSRAAMTGCAPPDVGPAVAGSGRLGWPVLVFWVLAGRSRVAHAGTGGFSWLTAPASGNTRTSQLPFLQVLASPSNCAARPGSCRKPPCALYIENGGKCVFSLPLIVRCGRTVSSRSGGAGARRPPAAGPGRAAAPPEPWAEYGATAGPA